MGSGTRKLVFFSLLVTLGTALHVVEMMIPNPFPIPGIKLGLANIVTLLTLSLYGVKEGLTVSFLRVLFGSLLSGTLFSPAFLLSMAGAMLSTLVMAVLISYVPVLSIIGISMAGAVFHNIGQLITASWLIQTGYIFFYLPVLLVAGLPAGLVTGYITRLLLQYLRKTYDSP